MGEQSYFQRQFCASRFKRTKFGKSSTPPDTLEGHPEDEIELEQTKVKTLSSTGEKDEAEPVERPYESQNGRDCDRLEEQTDSAISPLANGSPLRLQQSTSDPSASRQTNEPVQDHIETLDFHPEAPSFEPSETSESTGKHREGKRSKLLRATRAILMFRRATSSSLSHSDRTANLRSSRSLVASFWSRQSTATLDTANCDKATARVHSIDSFGLDSHQGQAAKASSTRAHSTLNALFGGGGDISTGSTGGRSQQQAAGSSFSLPRFIVPKINALKLPIVCLIKSLDDELMREIFIHRYELGQYLMDHLNVSLGMKDEKFFGLKVANSLDEQEDVRRPWLDLNESVYKQVSKLAGGGGLLSAGSARQHDNQHQYGQNIKSVRLYLRIKFYPPNLARVQDQFLKHYLWIQLRRDLRLGKLTSSQGNLTFLMACVLQYELGDHRDELINERLPQMHILPNQDLIEQQAIAMWQEKLSGVKKHLALMQFLRASVILETYGFDYYPVRDHQRQRAFLLGFNYAGVKTIRNGRIANHFRWSNLSKISYERRMIIFHIYPNENSKRKQILGFKCLSNDECQNLYLRLLEQKYFFTVDLTYFDKSIRRPSLLNDLSHSRSAELHQHQQPPPPTGTRPEPDQVQQAAADYFGRLLAGMEHDDGPAQQVEGQEAAKLVDPELANKRRFNYQHHGNQSSNNSTFDSSFECTQSSQANRCPSQALNGCNDSCSQVSLASSSCHQFPRRAHPPPPSLHAKSSSLQESDLPCNSLRGAQTPAPSSNQQPPTLFRRADSALPPASNETRPTHHKQLHHLQRQSSFASYSPDHPQVEPQHTNDSEQAEDSRRRSSLTPQNRDRLLDPGGLFWLSSQNNTDGHLLGPSRDALLQGLRLCLIMLVLNFFLRLSDGLCGFLIELLSFRRHESATQADVRPAE